MASSAALVAEAHGSSLRAISAKLGQHCEGLAAAARALRRAGFGNSRILRKLMQLDAAFSLTRHITQVSVREFEAELMDALGATLAAFEVNENPGVSPAACDMDAQAVVEPGGATASDSDDSQPPVLLSSSPGDEAGPPIAQGTVQRLVAQLEKETREATTDTAGLRPEFPPRKRNGEVAGRACQMDMRLDTADKGVSAHPSVREVAVQLEVPLVAEVGLQACAPGKERVRSIDAGCQASVQTTSLPVGPAHAVCPLLRDEGIMTEADDEREGVDLLLHKAFGICNVLRKMVGVELMSRPTGDSIVGTDLLLDAAAAALSSLLKNQPEPVVAPALSGNVAARLRQIRIGKDRPEYRFCREPRPKTPDPSAHVSKREFDRLLVDWRRLLHAGVEIRTSTRSTMTESQMRVHIETQTDDTVISLVDAGCQKYPDTKTAASQTFDSDDDWRSWLAPPCLPVRRARASQTDISILSNALSFGNGDSFGHILDMPSDTLTKDPMIDTLTTTQMNDSIIELFLDSCSACSTTIVTPWISNSNEQLTREDFDGTKSQELNSMD